MTSKSLYWAKWKENVKRRGWTLILCMTALFLMLPAKTLMELNEGNQSLQERIAEGMAAQEIEIYRQRLCSAFYRSVEFDSAFVLAMAFFAVLFAVQGFSFLYDKKKMDLYMSVPVSGPKRYVLIWANGILLFGGCYLLNLMVSWGIGAFFGFMNAQVLVCSLLAFLVNMLAFTAIYQLALLAVMLTGNVLTALLGSGVLFIYEPAVRGLYITYKSQFFISYCNMDEMRIVNGYYWTPFVNYMRFSSRCAWSTSSAVPDAGLGALGKEVLYLLIAAVLIGGLAYLLFRKRKAESYSQAISFPVCKGVLEILLLIPFSMATGLVTAYLGHDKNFFLFAGAFGGLVIGHALIQLIYERDLKAILRGKGLAAICLAATAFLVCVFRFDLLGYDKYLPGEDDLESLSVSLESDYGSYGRESLGNKEYTYTATDDILKYMNTQNPETIEAVLTLVSAWQQAGMPENNGWIEKSMATGIKEAAEDGEDLIWQQWFVVCYHLKNGKNVYRRFMASGDLYPEEMDALTRDEAYRRIRYQIYDESFAANLGRMKISYDDGRQDLLYTEDKDRILQALQKDFEGYSYRLISGELPIGILRFSMPSEREYKNRHEWDYPVYDSFSNTIEALAENGITAAKRDSILRAEDVKELTVYYNVYDTDQTQDSIFEKAEVSEQRITCSFTDPEQIREMLKGMYSQKLSDVAENSFAYIPVDRIGVRLTLSQEAVDNRYPIDEDGMFFLKGQVPEFVKKAIRDAAVYD